jgi:hypothetical protein
VPILFLPVICTVGEKQGIKKNERKCFKPDCVLSIISKEERTAGKEENFFEPHLNLAN